MEEHQIVRLKQLQTWIQIYEKLEKEDLKKKDIIHAHACRKIIEQCEEEIKKIYKPYTIIRRENGKVPKL